MKNWKEVISEVTAAQKRKAGEEVLKQLRSQAKQENKKKEKSSYQDYLERQLEFKKKKYEDQKKRQIEKIKEKDVEKHKQKAKASIAGIKKQQIGSGEPEGTAYSKLIGNVGSAAAGVGGAAYHGVKYLAAKRKAAKEAEEAKKRQQEKRERKSAGRPSSPKSQSSAPTETTPKQKLLPPSQKRLPPAGATGMRSPNFPTLGQRARKNPSLKTALIKKVNERYSNWRNELLIEVENKREKEKIKFINVMKGKNKVEIMPDEKNVNESIDKSKMKCNKPKAQAVGDSKTGKSHVVKACEGGKEKIIRFGQRGVKGSPKKEGESEAYANRRKRFKSRHAKNIARGKMSAAYWSDRVKW